MVNKKQKGPENKQCTLLVLQGPPASGKTSYAKKFVKDKVNWIRVSRDDLRLMCGDYWVLTRESLITTYENTLVEEALKKSYNVIVDATNLNPKTMAKWAQIASNFNCNLQVKEFFIPYEEAVKRDKNRVLQVGEDTIRSFYLRYYPDQINI